MFESMAYQVAKEIGALSTVLEGRVDAIVLSGGLAYCEPLVELIGRRVSFIARLLAYPGEDEMTALAQGALRVLSGREQAKEYAPGAEPCDPDLPGGEPEISPRQRRNLMAKGRICSPTNRCKGCGLCVDACSVGSSLSTGARSTRGLQSGPLHRTGTLHRLRELRRDVSGHRDQVLREKAMAAAG